MQRRSVDKPKAKKEFLPKYAPESLICFLGKSVFWKRSLVVSGFLCEKCLHYVYHVYTHCILWAIDKGNRASIIGATIALLFNYRSSSHHACATVGDAGLLCALVWFIISKWGTTVHMFGILWERINLVIKGVPWKKTLLGGIYPKFETEWPLSAYEKCYKFV